MSFPFQQHSAGIPQGRKGGTRHIALICAKAGLDECYPVLIMANAARMTGIKVSVFFTFYGLDVITYGAYIRGQPTYRLSSQPRK